MGNPLVEALYSFKTPEGDFVNEESIKELIQICPAVRALVDAGEKATNLPVNRGFLSTMGIVFDMIAGSGLEECLSSITPESVERIDKLVVGDKFSLIRDGNPLIPAVGDLVKEKPKPFNGGVLLALACVVKRAEEDYGPAESIKAYGTPPPASGEEEEKPKAPADKTDPTKNWNWAGKHAKTNAGPDKVTKVLSDLNHLGIPLENISVRPEKTDAGIELRLALRLGSDVAFEEIAKINAMMMVLLGKPVSLKSSTEIWIQMSL